MRKVFMVLGLWVALAIPTSALAGGHGWRGGHGWHAGHSGWRGYGFHHEHWRYGGNRYWGGRWWAYGVGPCWRWNPYYATWDWVCY